MHSLSALKWHANLDNMFGSIAEKKSTSTVDPYKAATLGEMERGPLIGVRQELVCHFT